MIDRAGQIWELDGGTIILVVRSYTVVFHYSTQVPCHDVLILKTQDTQSRFNHPEGAISKEWREGSKAWEEPNGNRWRLA